MTRPIQFTKNVESLVPPTTEINGRFELIVVIDPTDCKNE